MNNIGITTTVPIEVILAAGKQPMDLNNIFVNSPEPAKLITIAENDGFPLNTCAWIKGIYGAVHEHNITDVVCVTGGDCSNTQILMEVLRFKGIKAIPFSFPDAPCGVKMNAENTRFAEMLDTTLDAAEAQRAGLQPVRDRLQELDRLTWQENRVSSWENYSWLVSSSDFNGNIEDYSAELKNFLRSIAQRPQFPETDIRLGLTGVPPIFAKGLLSYLERFGARVVFNEIPRQFSMPFKSADLGEQYASYTYPYSMKDRLNDISGAIAERKIEGVIHYVQSFCHRAIGDILLRHELTVPVLTIEGNSDTEISQHLKTRLEAFVDMLQFKKQKREVSQW
ncbi:2-hydroxyglutaryl-CoA dehydratase D-component [Dehalogenimonas lykanthroporepellens BL-DC-9]|jgi:benzoyl-CoA reductase/2-hydroxyglutaryl-CoA dehydratase subunit BcrC/BadD/HgdB|nr:2-hydroxyglutaryl-CoA dehydratase D-component [Dehalogenimonas lykanthroporepellens BL-DC-9]